jgi:hypothetical protein
MLYPTDSSLRHPKFTTSLEYVNRPCQGRGGKGRGKGEEMTQTLYAHMNKKKKERPCQAIVPNHLALVEYTLQSSKQTKSPNTALLRTYSCH